MWKMMCLLLPLVIFAQGVLIDTVIPLSPRLSQGFFIPELNKLYIPARHRIFVINCSTYQVETIPFGWNGGGCFYSWNWRQRKLYLSNETYVDRVLVIDAVTDTVVRWVSSSSTQGHCFVSSTNRLYIGSISLKILDCASDSIIMEIEPPLPDYGFDYPFWDSVNNRLYVGMEKWVSPDWIAVYDCSYDSLVALFWNQVHKPIGLQIHYGFGKGYYAGYVLDRIGVIDIKNNTFLKSLPIFVVYGGMKPITLDTIDDKVYCSRVRYEWERISPDTIYVVDCLTDSIIKVLPYSGWGTLAVRWLPWSNRVCFTGGFYAETLKFIDCHTDSIVDRVLLGEYGPYDIQIDPIHRRIFAIAQDTASALLYVLRDVVPGVEEKKVEMRGNLSVPTVVRNVLFLPSAASGERLAAGALFDIAGRKVLELMPGANDVPHLAPGVYFVRAASESGFAKSIIKRMIITK